MSPLSPDDAEATLKAAASGRPSGGLQRGAAKVSGVRILVVEDDKQLAAGLRRGLEAEGYAVDVALTGTDGEWFAAENTYDALVVDVMLPGVAGDVLCARGARPGTGPRS